MPTRTCSRREWLAGLSLMACGRSRADSSPSVDESWRDASRGRDLPVRVRWPATAAPWPVVLYSHGLGGSREGGDAWGRAWQAAGLAVVHLQHPGSDSGVLNEGVARLREAGNAQQLLARVADVRFAIDEIERRQRGAASAWSQVRLDALGLAGHSFGAQTTLAVAGQRFAVPTDLVDRRPIAFIALSPSTPVSALPVQQAFSGIDRPCLVVTGSLDGDPFGSYATGEPRARVFAGLPAAQRALLWLDGADHMSFSGNAQRRIAGRGPFQRQAVAAALETQHHALVARITALWWRAHLLGHAVARAELAHPSGLAEPDRWVIGNI